MKERFAFVLVALGCMAGCNSTGVGNPSSTSSALLGIANDDEAEPDATDPEETLPTTGLRHAILVLGELRFLPCDSSYEDVVVPGQIIVNLVTARTEPALPEVSVPPGGFCGFDAPLTPAEAPAALAGRSMLFAGLRDATTLFILYASVEGTLRVRTRDGVSFGESEDGETSHFVWALRPRRWLARTELDSAEALDVTEAEDLSSVEDTAAIERIIPIDADRYPLLLALIRARLAGRSSLYADLNANGQVDLAERDDVSWLGSGLTDLD